LSRRDGRSKSRPQRERRGVSERPLDFLGVRAAPGVRGGAQPPAGARRRSETGSARSRVRVQRHRELLSSRRAVL